MFKKIPFFFFLSLVFLQMALSACKESANSNNQVKGFNFTNEALAEIKFGKAEYWYIGDCNGNGLEDFHIIRSGYFLHSYEVNSTGLTEIEDNEDCKEVPNDVHMYGARKSGESKEPINHFYADWVNLFKSKLPADCAGFIKEDYPPSVFLVGPRDDLHNRVITTYCGRIFSFDRTAPQEYEFRSLVELESPRPLYELKVAWNGKLRYHENYGIAKIIDFDGDQNLDVIISEEVEPSNGWDYQAEYSIHLSSDDSFDSLTRGSLTLNGEPLMRASEYGDTSTPSYFDDFIFEDLNGDRQVDIIKEDVKRSHRPGGATGIGGSHYMTIYLK